MVCLSSEVVGRLSMWQFQPLISIYYVANLVSSTLYMFGDEES